MQSLSVSRKLSSKELGGDGFSYSWWKAILTDVNWVTPNYDWYAVFFLVILMHGWFLSTLNKSTIQGCLLLALWFRTAATKSCHLVLLSQTWFPADHLYIHTFINFKCAFRLGVESTLTIIVLLSITSLKNSITTSESSVLVLSPVWAHIVIHRQRCISELSRGFWRD